MKNKVKTHGWYTAKVSKIKQGSQLELRRGK